MSLIDKQRFERRGPVGCSNSNYIPNLISCCGSFCIEDGELSDLYIAADDLSKRISLLGDQSTIHSLRCPFCDAVEWDLIQVQSVADVPSAWKWACRED
jgi:hypothetical protein